MSLSATSTVLSGGVVSEGIKQRIVVSILWKAELVSDVCQSGKFLHKTFHGCSMDVVRCLGITRAIRQQPGDVVVHPPPGIFLLLSYISQCNPLNPKMMKFPGSSLLFPLELPFPFPLLRATGGSKGTGFLVRCG